MSEEVCFRISAFVCLSYMIQIVDISKINEHLRTVIETPTKARHRTIHAL